jgi:hypothetical protein
MTIKGHPRSTQARWYAVVVGLLAAALPARALAQAELHTPSAAPAALLHADATAPSVAATGGDIVPAGCSSCGSGLLGSRLPAPGPEDGFGPLPDVPGCGCGGPCYPGRPCCDCDCDGNTCVGRFLNGVYHCICCPDPCYEPSWVPLANASLFVDPARPATQLRFRGDFGSQLQFPDKSEWFWAQENGKGPRFPGTIPAGQTKPPGSPNVDYDEGFLYMEGAIERFGLFVELSYRNVEPIFYPGASGFGDMNVGTKSLLIDCELLQFTFQFKAYLPTGDFLKGLGTGHTSLEPSFIAAIKLTPVTYFQVQTAFWFPIGGTQSFEGPVFHYHLSLNQLLCHCGRNIQLIGTLEANGFDLAGGAFTSPIDGLPRSSKEINQILNVGPGLRLDICNRVDFGVGSAIAVTKDRMSENLARVELRWRF